MPHKILRFIYVFTGSWTSVIVHTLFFATWFIFRFNLELLTNIVSLEAIYLCIFILMAQNDEQSERDLHLQEDSKNIAEIKSMLLAILNEQEEQGDILEEIVEDIPTSETDKVETPC